MAVGTAALIAMGVGAASSAYASHKASEAAKAQQALTQQAIDKQSGLSNTLADYSKDQYQLGKPALGTAIGMYQRLATGNRGDIQSEIAPDVAKANEVYGGTAKYLEQQGVRGGVRDTALAENSRAQAGTVGMMPFLARRDAIRNLGALGAQTTGQGLSGLSSAAGSMAGAASNQLGLGSQIFNQGEVQDNHIRDFGENLAGMLVNYLNQQKKPQGGGGSTGYAPGWNTGFG